MQTWRHTEGLGFKNVPLAAKWVQNLLKLSGKKCRMEIPDHFRGVQLWVPMFMVDSSAGVKLFLLSHVGPWSKILLFPEGWAALLGNLAEIWGVFWWNQSLDEPPVPPVLQQQVLSCLWTQTGHTCQCLHWARVTHTRMNRYICT